MAESPRIRHPTAVVCAPDGRVFVGEDPMDMEGPVDQPIDRVVCLHPDGRITVFATNLFCVFGLQYLDGKLYVNHAPKFSVLTDAGDTGTVRLDLLDYTNPRQPQLAARSHIPSNFRLAMDGFFYMAVGDNGIYRMKGRDESQVSLQGGGILRFRPNGTELEIFSTGTRNLLDLAINEEDEIFTYDNDDDGEGWWTRITHMVDGGFYGYPFDYRPPQPYILPCMAECGPGVPTCALAYNEDALPEEYQGALFLGEFGRSQIRHVQVARQGAGYRILSLQRHDDREFLEQSVDEFRPIGLALSPDGLSFYVTDWATHLELVRAEAGRLWRVTYTGKSRAASKPRWFQAAASGQSCRATEKELLLGLRHPALSVRLVAQRRLAERGATAVNQLIALLSDTTAPGYARSSAIWALDAIEEGKAARSQIRAALRDLDPAIRRQAARQLGTRRAAEAVPDLLPLLTDTDASVRFQTVAALGRAGSVQSIAPLLESLSDQDSFVRHAAFNALNRIGRSHPQSWPEIVSGLRSARAHARQGTLFALRQTWAEELVAALLAQFRSETNTDARIATLAALAEIARQPPSWDGQWWGLRPVTHPPPARTEDWAGTQAAVAALREAVNDADPGVRVSAITGLLYCRDTNSLPLLRARWALETNAPAARVILEALGEFRAPALGPIIQSLFKANPPREDLLSAAATAAEKLGGAAMLRVLMDAAHSDIGPQALANVLRALGRRGGEAAVPAIARHLTSLHADVWRSALAALESIGSENAVEAITSLVPHSQPEVRHELLMSLGRLKPKSAVPILLVAFPHDTTGVDVTYVLTQIPDLRALDVYLQGLLSPKAPLRELCLQAIASIQDQALPLIEERLPSVALPAAMVSRLQRLNDGFTATEWFVAGPFWNTDRETQLFNALPADGQLPSHPGETNYWRHVSGRPLTGKLDLRRALSCQDHDTNACVYAAMVISGVPGTSEVELTARCDDSLTLWHDAQPLPLTPAAGSPAGESLLRTRVQLKPGNNTIIARLGPVRSGTLVLRGSRPLQARRSPESYAAYARSRTGDAGKGKEVFHQVATGCTRCHRVGDEGVSIGPNLLGIGAKQSREQLIEAVLQPSRQIARGYEQTILRTHQGETFSGLLQAEGPGTVTLVESSGVIHSVDKSRILERRLSEVSLMPEGLQEALSLDAFADLIAYLQSLK